MIRDFFGLRRNRNRRKLRFKDPVTPRLLESAAAASGIDIDRFLEAPKKTLDETKLGIGQMQDFVNVVLENPPKLRDLALSEAEAIAYYALTDFFLHAYGEHIEGRMSVLLHSIEEQASRLQKEDLALS